MEFSSLPFPFPLEKGDIICKRASILTQLLCQDDEFCCIPSGLPAKQTLRNMLLLYDKQFFSGFLLRNMPGFAVTLSSRLTSSAGKFVYTRSMFGLITQAEIRMSSDFLTRLRKGPFLLNGLHAATAQEAFLIVFEHELCHAAEVLLFRSTGHSNRFLALANGLFGHTATRHSLPTRRQEAAESGLHVGSKAAFSYDGKQLQGIITYVGKSVTVMVPSSRGTYRDACGCRYEKYRVPAQRLTIL